MKDKGCEKKGSDQQVFISPTENVWRTVRRIYMLILGFTDYLIPRYLKDEANGEILWLFSQVIWV